MCELASYQQGKNTQYTLFFESLVSRKGGRWALAYTSCMSVTPLPDFGWVFHPPLSFPMTQDIMEDLLLIVVGYERMKTRLPVSLSVYYHSH